MISPNTGSKTIQIYKKVSSGVVNITSTTLSFDFFFNAVPEQGSGSGSIIDNQGHILTNYHVIENARLLEVTLPTDKQKFKAQIAQVKKKNDNLLWIDGISYPFEIPYMIDNFKSQDLYALLVNINHTWYVREFTHEHKHITEIKI